MKKNLEFRAALTLTATALGVNFASGRGVAAFYAQLGRAAWLGVTLSSLLFGAFMALLTGLARRCGAQSMPSLLRRAPGGGFGCAVTAMYLFIVAGGMCMALVSAGRVGALLLPMKNAFIYGFVLCLLIALFFALAGKTVLEAMGAVFYTCALLFVLALIFFGKQINGTVMRWALDLRLENNVLAAILFALLHTSTMVCMASGAAVRLSEGRMRPFILGAYAAIVYFALLGLGNAALRVHADELLALKLPFVALAAGWGVAGFYISGGMIFFAAVSSASGLLFAVIPKHKCPNLIEK